MKLAGGLLIAGLIPAKLSMVAWFVVDVFRR